MMTRLKPTINTMAHPDSVRELLVRVSDRSQQCQRHIPNALNIHIAIHELIQIVRRGIGSEFAIVPEIW